MVQEAGGALAEALAGLREAGGRAWIVTNEVGSGVVPAFESGRLFRDLLGELNAGVAAVCDDVVLVVAGRPLLLDAPTGVAHDHSRVQELS